MIVPTGAPVGAIKLKSVEKKTATTRRALPMLRR
jgi:hypothetical protein